MIIVTGGSGFIGSHVCSALTDAGHKVRIIDIMPPPFGLKAEFVRASVLDILRLQKLFAGADAVVHLAALVDVSASVNDPYSDFQVNVQGTLNVLEAARRAGVKKISYASSAAVYGEPSSVPVPESHAVSPMSPYGLSKLSAERYVLLYNRLYCMENTALRLFNVYGKGQSAHSPYSGVITKFSEAVSSGKQPVIFGNGRQTRDFVHADDVAAAFLAALDTQGCNSPMNIASGTETSVISLLKLMCSLAGKPANPEFKPAREGEILRSVADISLAKKTIGYSPQIPLSQGLREIVSSSV